MNNIEKLASSYIYWPELDKMSQKYISFGENSLISFSETLQKVIKAKDSSPDVDMIEFYALNEYLSSQRLKSSDILDDNLLEIYQLYQKKVDDLSMKIFCYLFVTAIAETKHSKDLNNGEFDENNTKFKDLIYDYHLKNKNYPSLAQQNIMLDEIYSKSKETLLKEYQKIAGEFYPKFLTCFNFLDKYFLQSPSDYTNSMMKNIFSSFKSSDINIEDLLKTVNLIFQKNSFGMGYGGVAWKKITEHALNFSQGKISSEVFIDQSFSLEHNNGSIFNKDIIFQSVGTFATTLGSPKHKVVINFSKLILDMQHSGEILNFLSLNNITNTQIIKIVQDTVKDNNDKTFSKINLNDSLLQFFNTFKKEATHYSSSSILKTILKQNKHNFAKINFQRFLYDEKNQQKESKEKNTLISKYLNLATQISSSFYKDRVQQSPLKEFVFEVFDISSIPKDNQLKSSLGSKAYWLSEMSSMGLPIPKAVVWTCDNSFSFQQNPKRWIKTLKSQMKGINLYNKDNMGQDVMVAIRSGAPVSMPGMMDTILNVGIDESNYDNFCQKLGKHTTDECAIRFMKMFSNSYFNDDSKWPKNIKSASYKFRKILNKNEIEISDGLFPINKNKQIELSIQAVFQSWNSTRAVAYREYHNLNNTGTAVIMQHMVFGNLNQESCTGVIFSRDCISGNKGLTGEYLVCSQGEDVVSGEVTPFNISRMKEYMPKSFDELSTISSILEEKTGTIQDIEFTIENGVVYILQCRQAVSSKQAQIKLLYDNLNENKINFQEFLTQVEQESISLGQEVHTAEKASFDGLCANPGVIQGICIKNEKDINELSIIAKNNNLKLILITEETKPEHIQLMIKSDAFLTQKGGFTSHAAILARSWNKPCIVGSLQSKKLNSGDIITMEASTGKVWNNLQTIQNKTPKIIKEVIENNKINVSHKKVANFNSFKTWRHFGEKTKVYNKIEKNFTKFLDMGYLSFMKMSWAKKNNFKAYR